MPQEAQWPEGLTDKEAVDRLHALILSAGDGVRDLSNDRVYRQFRKAAIARADLADVLPGFLRSQRDLNLLWEHLKTIGRRDRQARREYVTKGFQPLIDRVEGRSQPPIAASRWTGKRTFKQQAQMVLTIAPAAFQAVDLLLDEQERPLGNFGPVDQERLDAIAQLKELHAALGELIGLVQSGKPFDAQLRKVRQLRDGAFAWSKDTYELMLAQTPLMATSTIFGSAIWFLINIITKDVGAAASIAGGIVGGGAIATTRRR